MDLYMAPMEGITGHIFRNAHRKYFGGADKYFTPFISMSKKFSARTKQELNVDNNVGINLVPQIMVGNLEEVKYLIYQISKYGYSEFNINAGCPSGTVVTKTRGSGLLKDPEKLNKLLDDVASDSDINIENISIKTRIGWDDIAEWETISKIIGKYRFKEIIVHCRVRNEFYNGKAHKEAMNIAKDNIKSPICYNGDIYDKDDYDYIESEFPWVNSIMIGRGLLRNPMIFDEIRTGAKCDGRLVYDFLNDLFNEYRELFGSDINTLYHIKEMWFYLGQRYLDCEKDLKIIKKTKSVAEYKEATKRILLS